MVKCVLHYTVITHTRLSSFAVYFIMLQLRCAPVVLPLAACSFITQTVCPIRHTSDITESLHNSSQVATCFSFSSPFASWLTFLSGLVLIWDASIPILVSSIVWYNARLLILLKSIWYQVILLMMQPYLTWNAKGTQFHLSWSTMAIQAKQTVHCALRKISKGAALAPSYRRYK